jgi:XamI restriction endonuclease
MAVNRDKPDRWKVDVAKSVDMYNDWFLMFAPDAFRKTRIKTTEEVRRAFLVTANLTMIAPEILRQHPELLPVLRMSTCPPLALDRLIGLSGVPSGLVKRVDREKKLPTKMSDADLNSNLKKLTDTINQMVDIDIVFWKDQRTSTPGDNDIQRAATIIADRLCGADANPIIRNAQEKRQLAAIKDWLEARGYREIEAGSGVKFNNMAPGTFSFRVNVPIRQSGSDREINIPIDAVIRPKSAKSEDLPIFFEAKSAGDFTNTNKRRKEEATKLSQLKHTYGKKIRFNLFLCGYFDSGYLGYEASEGIDWVWEHRIEDLANFGI